MRAIDLYVIDNCFGSAVGYRQSYSGSEASTDLSMSSMENLSLSARQEPQGEETVTLVPSPSPVDPAASLDLQYSHLLAHIAAAMPASAMEVKSTNATFYVTGSRPISTSPSPHNQV